MALLLTQIETMKFTTPGLVVPASPIPDRGTTTQKVQLAVDNFPAPRNPYMEPSALPARAPSTRSTAPMSVKDLLLARLEANVQADREDASRAWLLSNWEVVGHLINALELGDAVEECVLHHWDLEARNILVDPETGRIVGVLDWDQVQAVPRVLGRRAPVWLWDEGEGWEEGVRDEWDGDADEVDRRVPGKEGNRIVYERFLGSVGEGWRGDAEGEGRWVRRVWRAVSEGLWSSVELERLERLLEDWNEKNRGDEEMEG